MFTILADTYQMAAPHVDPSEVARVIAAAVNAARLKHPDFDRFLPAMEFLSTIVFTDHRRIPLGDYLEVLYCAVKHSDFAKPWRVGIRDAQRRAQETFTVQ